MMEIYVVIGGVLFLTALAGAVILTIMIVAEAMSPGRKSGPGIPGQRLAVSAGGSTSEQGRPNDAQCYWECMDGFHWAADWEKLCSSACGLTEKPGVA